MAVADQMPPDDASLQALAADLGRALLKSGLRLALAESCTGGWIAKALTDNPGSADWFEAGFVTYSNAAKTTALGVSAAAIATDGAVSEAVVRAMAAGARQQSGADAAIAVSGIAGPTGGSPEKPVGLVWFGWSLGDRDWTRRKEFAGDRDAVRRQAVALGISELLDALEPNRSE
jgi:nicotinamide-nucleotide amidase